MQEPSEFLRYLIKNNGHKHTTAFVLSGCGMLFDIILYSLNKLFGKKRKDSMRIVMIFPTFARLVVAEKILFDLGEHGIQIAHITLTSRMEKDEALEILFSKWDIALITLSKVDELVEIEHKVLNSIKLIVFDDILQSLFKEKVSKHFFKQLKQLCKLSL